MNNTSVPPQGEPYLYDDAGAAAPVSMSVWLKAAWRRKWLMLLVLLLVLGAGVLFTHFQKRVYEATALLSFSERSSGAFRIESGERVTAELRQCADFPDDARRDPGRNRTRSGLGPVQGADVSGAKRTSWRRSRAALKSCP